MVFDSTTLARVAADIRRMVMGARVERVFVSGPQEITLDLRRKLPRPQITLSWSPEFGRIHMGANAEPQPGTNLPIADVMRKYLRGAALVGCEQIGFDRILHLHFANCAGMGPESRTTVVAEIMGRHANLALLDPDQTILGCAKFINVSVNRYRETLPGIKYTPPPGFDRIDPHELSSARLSEAARGGVDTPLRKFIRSRLTGASDIFLDETIARGQVDPDAVLDDQPPDWPELVSRAVAEVLAEAEGEGPGYLYAPVGQAQFPEFAHPLVLRSNLDLEAEEVSDISEALEMLVYFKRVGREIRERSERITGFAQRALKKVRGRERERAKALRQAEQGDELRQRGELILGNLHAIPPGASEVLVTDYFDPEQAQVTLELDPNYSAKENAQALFDRYKRAKRVQDRVPGLLRAARMEREYLEGVLEQVRQADSLDDVHQLEHEMLKGDYVGAQAKRKRKPPNMGAVEPRRFTSVDSYPVMYGKTGTQNDAVVRAANGDDLWFHVKDGPGGHVVVRTDGKPDSVPETTIVQAASVAAWLSHWRTDSRADVNYTEVRHLHKRKGAPPGFVTYRTFNTVTVPPAAPPKR